MNYKGIPLFINPYNRQFVTPLWIFLLLETLAGSNAQPPNVQT